MNYTKKKLKNGLRVITVPMKDNPTVTVLVLVEAGSKYETKNKNGISHFLEHMCFKGTENRPGPRIISNELDGLGSQNNAFTSHEYTGYYAKSGARHFKQLFSVISDIYLNSTFPKEELEREKGVIIEEIRMYEDLPQRKVYDIFSDLLYGTQPAGWTILGPEENIRNMSRKDFVKYHETHYVPNKTTVVVAGNISSKEVEKEVEKIFGKLKRQKRVEKKKVTEKQKAPQVQVHQKKTDQSHMILGVRTFPAKDKRNTVLAVLSTVLGKGMSSRLFVKLREEMGVAYYVRAGLGEFTDHGFLSISAGVTNSRLKEVVSEILKECALLKRELVGEEELQKAKEYLIGNLKLEHESSDAWAFFAAEQEIFLGKIETLEDIEKKIRKVTAGQVQKLAEEIFVDTSLNLAVVGPHKNEAALLKLLSFEK